MALLPDTSGGAGPAGSWKYNGAISTIQLTTGSDVVDAVTLSVTETTYNVPFKFTVSAAVYKAEGWKALASDYAGVVELVATYDGVQAIVYAQDTNAANQLIDTLIVTVGTDDGLTAIDVQVHLIVPFSQASTAAIQSNTSPSVSGSFRM